MSLQILLPGVVSREERDQSKLTQQLAVAVQAAKTSSPVAPVAAPPAAASAPLTTTGGTLTRAEYAALDARLAALENALGSGATVREMTFFLYYSLSFFLTKLIDVVFFSLDHCCQCCDKYRTNSRC